MMTLTQALHDWEAIIGLEVHCELTALETKLFCGCKLEFGAEPNTRTCPVCLGLPGALPAPNRAAIESIVLAGLAVDCRITPRSLFYRKGYLYPDMPKNYQITQGPVAFCMDGHLDLDMNSAEADERLHRPDGQPESGAYTTRIGIERIHLEEDAGKMVHIGGRGGRIAGADYSLVDYNRAGAPLIELVTRPDLRTPGEARRFLQKLRQVFLALGISDCSMEKGSLRADGNVSLRRRGTTQLGTKTELKNLNSFKGLHDALAYEICRQAEALERGHAIRQETRHWDPSAKETLVMRMKETADDYRMFPDPDLAPVELSGSFVERMRRRLPELPEQKAARYASDFGLPAPDAHRLLENREVPPFFEACMELAGPQARALSRPLANLLLNEVAAYGSGPSFNGEGGPFTPARALALVKLLHEGALSFKQGKEVLAAVIAEARDPADIIAERGMRQVSDIDAIGAVVDSVLAANAEHVAAYRKGKTGLLGFLVGRCMKEMRGQGNPKVISQVLRQRLG